MSRNEEILRFAVANTTLEGMPVSQEERDIIMDCLEGRRTFEDAIRDIFADVNSQKVAT